MFLRRLVFFFIASLFFGGVALATDYSSSNFTAVDPVITTQSGYSTSSHFQLIGSSGPLIIGEGVSASYLYRAGFLYYPVVTAPVLSAVAADSSAQLNWTAAAGYLGISIASYDVGKATVSGGPYTFSSVGNTLSSLQSSLTNGSVYYFVVRARDAYATIVATSTEISVTPVAGSGQPGSGGSGGGGGSSNQMANVVFTGWTFPGGLVYIVENGVIIGTTQSRADGSFEFSKQSLAPGNALFSLYAEDRTGERTGSVSLSATLKAGETTRFDNIILPPYASTNKEMVKQGDPLTIFGRGVPNTTVLITIDELPGVSLPALTNDQGYFSTILQTDKIIPGTYTTRSTLKFKETISPFSRLVEFKVGDTTIDRKPPLKQCGIADFDCNGRVDLVDFSILLYWFDKPKPPEEIDLNHDGGVNIIDFSILMYYWTG